MLSIVSITEWPAAAIEGLLTDSEKEGFRFVRRANDEWQSGANRFSREGEVLFGVFEAESLVAIGGINRESESRGRLRRFYVRPNARGRGIGGQLVHHLLAFAHRRYSRVALRCDTDTADRFYCALGFNPVASEAGITHVIVLRNQLDQPPDPTSASFTSLAGKESRQP